MTKIRKDGNGLSPILQHGKSGGNEDETPHKMIRSTWVLDIIDEVVKHTTANERQCCVKVLQNIAYLFTFGGMVKHNLPFYAVDLSPSGAGKTEVVKKTRELLLSPVMDYQQMEHSGDLERYKEEILSAKGKEKEFVELPQLYKCIHVTETSPEALFESFEIQKSQMIEFGEMGRKLKNPKHQSLIDYVIEGFGAKELPAPNFKNQRFKKLLKIENPQLFFYGDTTIKYLGKGAFFEHIEGGLLNRCLLVFNNHVPTYDELPDSYTIDETTIQRFNNIAVSIIEYAKKYQKSYLTQEVSAYRKDCERYLYDKRKELIDANSPFANLYTRSIQHFRTLINLFHLIKCFDLDVFIEFVEDETVEEAFSFLLWQQESYLLLMDEFSGVMDDIRLEDKSNKIVKYIAEQKLPIGFRQVYRKFHVKKKDVEIAVAGIYAHNGKQVLSKKGTK